MRHFAVHSFFLALCTACGDKEPEGMPCDETASLCGSLSGPSLSTPIVCSFIASDAAFGDPPAPDAVWDAGGNAIERTTVESLPFAWALNDLEFWEGGDMWVMAICDGNDDGTYSAEDPQGVYGGTTAELVPVPSTGIDITL